MASAFSKDLLCRSRDPLNVSERTGATVFLLHRTGLLLLKALLEIAVEMTVTPPETLLNAILRMAVIDGDQRMNVTLPPEMERVHQEPIRMGTALFVTMAVRRRPRKIAAPSPSANATVALEETVATPDAIQLQTVRGTAIATRRAGIRSRRIKIWIGGRTSVDKITRDATMGRMRKGNGIRTGDGTVENAMARNALIHEMLFPRQRYEIMIGSCMTTTDCGLSSHSRFLDAKSTPPQAWSRHYHPPLRQVLGPWQVSEKVVQPEVPC